MRFSLQFHYICSKSLLIQWPSEIKEDINFDIVAFNILINEKFSTLLIETVTAYNSLTLYLKETTDTSRLIDELKLLYSSKSGHNTPLSSIWNIPVCYDLSIGLDLQNLADSNSLSVDEVIQLHSQTLYHVYFLGFLPGFPYLGGLDSRLVTPRLKSPRIKIPKGSVAIGDQQTGIYPSASPGGWNIIGRTPIALFDVNRPSPTFINVGDKVQFIPISIEQYQYLLEKVNSQNFNLEDLTND